RGGPSSGSPRGLAGERVRHLGLGETVHRPLEDVAKRSLILLGQGGNRSGGLGHPLRDLDPHPLPLVGQYQELHAPVALGGLGPDQSALLETVDDARDVRVVAEERVRQIAHLPGAGAQHAEGDHLLRGELELLPHRDQALLVGDHHPVHQAPGLAARIGAAALAAEPRAGARPSLLRLLALAHLQAIYPAITTFARFKYLCILPSNLASDWTR